MSMESRSMALPRDSFGGRTPDSVLHSELDRLREHLKRNPRGLVGGTGSVNDLAQEAAYRLLDRKDGVQLESRRAVRGYLWKTAKRLIIDRWRSKGRRGKSESVESLASELFVGEPIQVSGDRDSELLSALKKLSFHDRRILELAYLHEVTVGEIASELGISDAAVKMRLSRARERLRERLSGRRGVGE